MPPSSTHLWWPLTTLGEYMTPLLERFILGLTLLGLPLLLLPGLAATSSWAYWAVRQTRLNLVANDWDEQVTRPDDLDHAMSELTLAGGIGAWLPRRKLVPGQGGTSVLGLGHGRSLPVRIVRRVRSPALLQVVLAARAGGEIVVAVRLRELQDRTGVRKVELWVTARAQSGSTPRCVLRRLRRLTRHALRAWASHAAPRSDHIDIVESFLPFPRTGGRYG